VVFHEGHERNPSTQSRRGPGRFVTKSLNEYEKWERKYPAIHFEQKGLMMVSRTQSGVDAAVEELNYVKDLGVPGKVLNSDDIATMEPL